MLIELRLSSAYKPLRVQTLAKSLAAFGDSCYILVSNKQTESKEDFFSRTIKLRNAVKLNRCMRFLFIIYLLSSLNFSLILNNSMSLGNFNQLYF